MNKNKFLRSQKILRLATIDKDDIPHVVPVWYLYRNGNFYIGTNSSTKKAQNVMINHKVSFCIDTGIHSPICGIMGIGNAKIILRKKHVFTIAKKILMRYFKNLDNSSAQEILSNTNCIIEVIPKKVVIWRF